MNAEKKRNVELQKREKQLKAQIDNLITDSLGLLKTRLKELGIQAKTPPEFIEKAKGIVSSHHELQKNKLSLEREIRQLEAERDTLIASKEQELIEKYTKERKDLHPSKIREYVKRELETANGMSSVAPLLNKLSDVTFTKCSSSAAMVTSAVSGTGGATAGVAAPPGVGSGGPSTSSISEQITTQIRKRPREQIHKQRDWPEKRAKTAAAASGDWSSAAATSMAKIEENNPEALAKKILEQGRSLEMSSHHRTSAATLTISPTKGSNQKSSFPPHHLGAPGVEVRKIEPPGSSSPPPPPPFSRVIAKTSGGVHIQPSSQGPPIHPTSRSAGLVVDLPKIDISMSMGAATSTSSVAGNQSSASQPPPPPPPPLILPPHPDSRSQSSDHTDDLSFAKSKMSTTPRAEQFEDRLKSIIHSVLSSDAPDGGRNHPKVRGPPPAAHSGHLPSPVPPPPPQQQLQQQSAPPAAPPAAPPPAAHSRAPSSSMLPSPSSSSSQQPMFSPVKRELPMHLPPPPSTHAHPGVPPPRFHHPSASTRPPTQSGPPPPPPPPPAAHHYPPASSPYAPPPTATSSSPYAPPPPPPSHAHHMKLPPRSSPSQHQQQHQHHQQHHQQHQHHHHHHRQSPSSHRTMGDLIVGELERNLPPPQPQHIPSSQSRQHPPPSPPAHPRSSRPYVEPAGIPGNPREYLPRAEAPTMLRMSQVIEDSIRGHVKASELEGLACPRTKSPEGVPPVVPAPSSSSLRAQSSRAEYPAMEGLAARFGPYMESANKRDRVDPVPSTAAAAAAAASCQRGMPIRGGLPPPPPPPASSPMAMSLHDGRRPPPASHSGRRSQPSAALPSPPVLPPKKQHLDDHPDYRLPKGTS